MDASRKVAVVLALKEYKELQSKFVVHQQNMEEDDRKRRMALISIVLRSRQQLILKTGTEWEIMLNWSDVTFARHLRISKLQFEYLLTKLQENGLHFDHTQGRPPVPDTKKLLIFLWYMANQNSFKEICDKFDVSQSAAHRIILQVLTIMSGMGYTFISWPNACEKAASAAAFHRTCGLDGVIGAIDGCHIRVQRPPIRGGDYMNHKAYYSVLLQGIVDDRGRFIDIFAGPPGRVHDARMLSRSTFYTQWQEKMEEYCLLGDSAYIGQDFPFIKTPKRDNGALTVEDLEHNAKISQGRVIVENAFGRMKCKWRRLHDLKNTRIDTVVMIIMSACFLHNMCVAASDVCGEHRHGCPRQEDHNE